MSDAAKCSSSSWAMYRRTAICPSFTINAAIVRDSRVSGYKQFYRRYFNICGQSAEALLIADIRQRFSH